MLLSPSSSPRNAPLDRSNSLGDLAARIADTHARVAAATRSALEHAMDAGDLLAEAQERVGHGRWESWLKKSCNIPPRTASHYMRLAEHRELIEVKSATVADLTVNAALRLLKPNSRGRARGRNGPRLSLLPHLDRCRRSRGLMPPRPHGPTSSAAWGFKLSTPPPGQISSSNSAPGFCNNRMI